MLVRRLSTLLVFMQSAIVVTGASVRLTGSGLGCSTWPECTPGSYTPTPNQPETQLHAWIEFGNRLLTFVLFLNAVTLFLTILIFNLRKLTKLAGLQILGILAQAIIGGITVLTGLNPISVASHFLLSIVVIAGALSLRQRAYGATPSEVVTSLLSRRLGRALLALTLLVIVMGTVVTGSGPHAGDEAATRFSLDAKTMAWIHADLVIALVGLTLALVIAIKLGETERTRLFWGRKVRLFLIVILAQGGIGYVQYFTGLPEIIVAAHVCGAVLVWLSAWNIAITGNLLRSDRQ